ncbi:DNA-binding protein [Pantoea dispersa]|uniref:DNA-binding protein n=1 Tax=Pantoea TaxID=53335 RepID=UPI001FF09B23|nr:DNA-binding protein [Pantoea ananatis]
MQDINFKIIERMTPEQLQDYIDKNHFSDTQALKIYQHHNKNHKKEMRYIARKEGIRSIAKGTDYVHMFTKNFEQLANMDISSNELKVIAKILNKMEFGNCFHVSQAKLCKELNIKKSNMSIIFKKLKSKAIIIDKDGDLFMNSNIFLKGQYHTINEKQRPNVQKAQVFNVDDNPVFQNVYSYHSENDINESQSEKYNFSSQNQAESTTPVLNPPPEIPKDKGNEENNVFYMEDWDLSDFQLPSA